jgi:hypothetical protein
MTKPYLLACVTLFISQTAFAERQRNGPELDGSSLSIPVDPNYYSINGIDLATLSLSRANGKIFNLTLNGTMLNGVDVNGHSVDATGMLNLTMSANLVDPDSGKLTPVQFQITAVQPLDSGANKDVILYQMQYLPPGSPPDSTDWKSLCKDPDDNSNWAIPISGSWEGRQGHYSKAGKCVTHCHKSPGEGGAYDCETVCQDPTVWNGGMVIPGTETTTFTFGCRHVGAIAKCVEMGYKPWLSSAMADLHLACSRMIRADYCGDGMPHTVVGTSIDVMDYLSIQKPSPTDASTTVAPGNTPYYPEAEWGPNGAVCITYPRFTDDPTSKTGGKTADYVGNNCKNLIFSPAVPTCNQDWQKIMDGSVSHGTYTPNPDFTTIVNGSPLSLLQNFSPNPPPPPPEPPLM